MSAVRRRGRGAEGPAVVVLMLRELQPRLHASDVGLVMVVVVVVVVVMW